MNKDIDLEECGVVKDENRNQERLFFDESLILQQAVSEFERKINHKETTLEMSRNNSHESRSSKNSAPENVAVSNRSENRSKSFNDYHSSSVSLPLNDHEVSETIFKPKMATTSKFSLLSGEEAAFQLKFEPEKINSISALSYLTESIIRPKTSPESSVFIEKSQFVTNEKERIKEIGKILSIKREFDQPSTLGVGLRIEEKRILQCSFHPKETLYRGRPKLIHSTNFHPQVVQDIANKSVYKQPELIHKKITNTATHAPESTILSLKLRLSETTTTLKECINTLAEEHRQSKRWKAQYEKAQQCLLDLHQAKRDEEYEKRVFLEKRQGVVNAILPLVTRPKFPDKRRALEKNKRSLALNGFKGCDNDKDTASIKNQTKCLRTEKDSLKYKIKPAPICQEENVRIYIPRLQAPTCVSSLKQTQEVQLWTDKTTYHAAKNYLNTKL